MKKIYFCLVLSIIIMMLTFVACSKDNRDKAKEMMKEDETRPEIQVSILFDNSLSYKNYIDDTLINVKKVFQYLAANYNSNDDIKVSLILIDSEATIIFNGKAKDLQRPYDDVEKTLKTGQSNFTDLTGAVNRALYFFKEGNAKRKVMLLFTDMKASTPKYHPKDDEVVPPPREFPWDDLKKEKIEIFAFFVPYKERVLWQPVTAEKGMIIKAMLPEEMKTESAYKLVFMKNE